MALGDVLVEIHAASIDDAAGLEYVCREQPWGRYV